ncbi:MAG: hypothetical protein ACFFA5_07340 [Promethearchaeota archaeon]
MDFKNELESYFKLRTFDERKKKIVKILNKLKRIHNSDPVFILDMIRVYVEYSLVVENNDERSVLYQRALKLVHNVQNKLKKTNQLRLLLRSFCLECLVRYHTMKYEDEDATLQTIFELGGKIIKLVNQAKNKQEKEEYYGYYSIGCVWRAYGLISQLIIKAKELSLNKRQLMLDQAKELAVQATRYGNKTDIRDARILSSYISAFVKELHSMMLQGDFATTEEHYIEFMHSYEILFEVARAYGSIEFEYIAFLNILRLKLLQINYAAGISRRKKELFNNLLEDFKKAEEYENIIHQPHLKFYRYAIQARTNTSIVYFEAVKEEDFKIYIDEALKIAEKLKEIYKSNRMKSIRDKVEQYYVLNTVYMLKASLASSRQEKLEYLKKSEQFILEEEKFSATYSPQVYFIWRDLYEIYLDLSKVERDQKYSNKCIFYAKKTYNSALETENFTDALFAAYVIAISAEDYQDYNLSMKYYELASNLIERIVRAGKDYSYYHDLKTYLQARLLGVKAKEVHSKGDYAQAMALYTKASSVLQSHKQYSYDGILYNIYALFEEASMRFIDENYRETIQILSNVTRLFDEATQHHAEDLEPQFQYYIDRRAYDQQQLFLESSKAFCFAQSNILQSLIYRYTGESEEAVELLKVASTQLSPFVDRNSHIAGYYEFTNGLFGLEKSELAAREGDYQNAASYLAIAADQFESASKVLTSDERLNQLCKGLKFFCQGWMYALEIMRRETDLNPAELDMNFTHACQFFENATNSLKIFKRTAKSVSGFLKLLNYTYYSLLFQKTDDPTEKNTLNDKIIAVLSEALQHFKDAEDMERYGFVKDLLATLPQLNNIEINIFKPIAIPFTPYTPVFDVTTKFEPSGVNFVISLNKNQIEMDEEIQYSIEITSDTSVYIKQIDGMFPKKDINVVSKKQLVKNGTVEINRFLSPGHLIDIEFTIQASAPFYNKTHPRLIFLNTKNEKRRAFTSPLSIQVYPKNTLKTGVVSEINEKIDLVEDILQELGIVIGKFPILYHDINSYRETLAEYYFRYESEERGKKHRSKKTEISEIPIQQMAFVNPLGEVNILYDLETYLYPQSIANLLSIIIHEKFGHGFFQQFTTLGKKLLELEYHHKGIELLTIELEKISNKYATGIQWLAVSTLIVDEGFATWLELKTFEKLLEKTSDKDSQFIQQIHHEIESFKKTVFESEELNVKHEYFALKYDKPVVNPYTAGYDLFLQIEEKYGEKCVPKALEIAANVPLTRRQISLMPNTIKNDKNCADKRLEKIARSELKIESNNVDMFEKAVKELFL